MSERPPSAPADPIRFVPAGPSQHGPALLALNTEYLAWLHEQLARHLGALPAELAALPVEVYAAQMLDKVCADTPPHGCFYLIEMPTSGAEAPVFAGMGGLRRLDGERAELKRIYLRPGLRGQGLGRQLVRRLMDDARRFGYRQLCLDTAPFMQEARSLYRRLGFQDGPVHAGTEVPPPLQTHWHFMQCTL